MNHVVHHPSRAFSESVMNCRTLVRTAASAQRSFYWKIVPMAAKFAPRPTNVLGWIDSRNCAPQSHTFSGRGIWHGGSAPEHTGTCQVPGLNQHIHEAGYCAMCDRVATHQKDLMWSYRNHYAMNPNQDQNVCPDLHKTLVLFLPY